MELRFALLLGALFFAAPAAAAQLTLAWTDTSNNEGGFRIERRTSGGSFAQIAQVAANATSFVDSSVTAGTTYCYRVRGYNQQSVSAYTNEACGAPASPSAQAVTISASPATATEGGGAGQFLVRRTGSTAAALTVNLTVGGTASAGGDYATLPTTVVIPAGASSAAITVRPTDDTAVESNETVVVTLKAGTGYTVGASSSATVSVVDNDAAITIDNGGTGTSFTGTWSASAASNPHGSTSLYATGAGQDTYRWTPTIPTTRAYQVYAWWTAYPSRSTNVQYRIVSTGGTTVTTRDQRTGGGQWQSLGTFQFNAGTAGYVQVSDVNGGTVSADAIRWVPSATPPPSQTPPGGIVIENGGTGTSFTGTWLVSAGPNPHGSNSLYASGSGEDTYRWRPTIPAMRTYDVYAWWTAYPNRSTNVQYRIVSAQGTAVTSRNQRSGGGQWQHLGTFQFNAGTGGYVQVSDTSGSTVSADAVLFAPR